jgi:hypothetical protein
VHPTGQVSGWLMAGETSSILTAYNRRGDRFFAEMCDRIFTLDPSVVAARQLRTVRNPANS